MSVLFLTDTVATIGVGNAELTLVDMVITDDGNDRVASGDKVTVAATVA